MTSIGYAIYCCIILGFFVAFLIIYFVDQYKAKKSYEKLIDASHKDIQWGMTVYRNVNNLCWKCGQPATTTTFSDVPTCEEHKDG